jgi:hypothetical protein
MVIHHLTGRGLFCYDILPMNKHDKPKSIIQLGRKEAEFLATLSGQGKEISPFGEALELFSGDRARAHRYLYNLRVRSWPPL